MCAHAYHSAGMTRSNIYDELGYNDYRHEQILPEHGGPSTMPYAECCFNSLGASFGPQHHQPAAYDAYTECVADCPLVPLDCSALEGFGVCPPEACPDCDPKQPAVTLGSLTHPFFADRSRQAILCEHTISLHNHDQQGNVHISHGHVSHNHCHTRRASTPVKRIAEALAEECKHFLRRDECLKCTSQYDSSPMANSNSSPSPGMTTESKGQPGHHQKTRNKEAAQKYRNKLKSRFNKLLEEEKKLRGEHQRLVKIVGTLEEEVKWHRGELLANAAYWRKRNGVPES